MMKKYFILVFALILSFVFVSGQAGLGVPTTYPANPIFSTPVIGGSGFLTNPQNPQRIGLADVNGDGVKDILVTTAGTTTSNNLEIFSGRDGNPLSIISSAVFFGIGSLSVEGIGDVNGDAFEDFAVGTPGGFGTGAVQVYSGATNAIIYTLYGTNSFGRFGNSLVSLGDINGNNIPDFAVSSAGSGLLNSISVKIYDGAVGTLLNTINPPTSIPSAPFSITGNLEFLGDINGDSIPEILIGGYYQPTNSTSGVAYVYSINGVLLYTLNPPVPNSYFGMRVTSVDYNTDGVKDFFISDYSTFGFTGPIDVYSGSNGVFMQQVIPTIFPIGTGINYVPDIDAGSANGDALGDIFVSQVSLSTTITSTLGVVGIYSNNGLSSSLLYSYGSGIGAGMGYKFKVGDLENDQIDELISLSATSTGNRIEVYKLGGVYSYGSGALTATWIPVSGLGSQGTVSITGFNPGEQGICVAISGSPANFQISPNVNVYVNPNDLAFFIDCSLSANFNGIVNIPNINIQNSAIAGNKAYAFAIKSDLSASSNGLEFTFLA